MSQLLTLLIILSFSSCASSMGRPQKIVKEEVPAMPHQPAQDIIEHKETDAKNLIESHCKTSNMSKIPRLRLVDVYLCGKDLSIQVNKNFKEEHVKLLLNHESYSQKIIIKNKESRAELKKLIVQTYAKSDEARFSPPEEVVVEKSEKTRKKKNRLKPVQKTKKKA